MEKIIKRPGELTFIINEPLPRPNPHYLSLGNLLNQLEKKK